MAYVAVRAELNCSVCMEIYNEPVTLPCGHNFCQRCIEITWDAQVEMEESPSCPECRKRFGRKPELRRNQTLHNIARGLLSTHPPQEGTGIYCTYCDSPVTADKSCLLCEASLCVQHVAMHSKTEEHLLTAPTTSLGNRKCPAHRKLLEYYCSEDGTCICVSCLLVGEHRGHKVELLNKASEKKKEKLRTTLEKLAPRKEKTEKTLLNIQNQIREMHMKAAKQKEHFVSLFKDIRDHLEALENQVLDEIHRQEEKCSLQLSDLIQQLEMKKLKLIRKVHHIEELCNVADPLTVLQEWDSGRPEEGDDEDRELSPTVTLDEDLILVTLMIGLEGIVADVKGEVYGQEATEMFLDINTAGQLVDIAGDNDTVAYIGTEQGHPDVPQRFRDYPQVLSTSSFSSGRHYWNVEVTMTGDWGVGVAYPSIAREGAESLLGNNNKSWILYKTDDEYSVRHDSQYTILPHTPLSEGIKISLDYEAGRLSFYELSEPIRRLHTFTASFTEPLHAAYWVWDCAWVRT